MAKNMGNVRFTNSGLLHEGKQACNSFIIDTKTSVWRSSSKSVIQKKIEKEKKKEKKKRKKSKRKKKLREGKRVRKKRSERKKDLKKK